MKFMDRMNQPVESSILRLDHNNNRGGPANSNGFQFSEAKGSRYEEIRSVLAKLRDGSELQVGSGGRCWAVGVGGVFCSFFCGGDELIALVWP